MNRVYRIIWSDSQQAFVVVSELAKGHCKSSRQNTTDMKKGMPLQASSLSVDYRLLPHSISQILGVSLLGLSLAYADPAATQLPTGGQITQGSGSISQS
ncbi:MAG: ESPR domain-containing protein, partial [Methylococcaceae bacterium]